MFITFEGIEGCGKSTQSKLLYKHLIDSKRKSILTHEAGGSPFGEHIREILLNPKNDISPMAEFLLFAADRTDHTKYIRECLSKDYIVVSDRFTDSSLAYQGYGKNVPLDFIKTINHVCTSNLIPDITFFLDISVEESLKRIYNRSCVLDRFESNSIDFFTRIYNGYKQIIAGDPNRFIIIDGTLPVEKIHTIIKGYLE